MRIIGIDPGTRKLGIGIIENRDFVAALTINLKTSDFQMRLSNLATQFRNILNEYKPDMAFLESTIYHKNVKTAIQLGAVRGVVLLLLAEAKIETRELSPTRIKGSITGNGQAKKQQVAFMIRRLLNIPEDSILDENATDALACALAGFKSLS